MASRVSYFVYYYCIQSEFEQNYRKLSRNFVGAIRTTTTNCKVSFIDLCLVFPINFRMIFLPHTNTVILLEPYSGTITERWLPVVSWNAASKACLQALPPFPPPQATAQLASLPRIFFLFKIFPFHAFFPNCGAWSQASPHFLTIGYCQVIKQDKVKIRKPQSSSD